MKYAFYTTKKAAESAVTKINEELGIPSKDFGFPGGLITTYSPVEKIETRWGFPVIENGEAKVDHLDAVKGKLEDYETAIPEPE